MLQKQILMGENQMKWLVKSPAPNGRILRSMSKTHLLIDDLNPI